MTVKDQKAVALPGEISVKSFEALPSGALKIRGIGANYLEDIQSERFVPGAFEEGLRTFMARRARPLLFAHDASKVLGRVTSAELVDGVGVVVEAIVDYQLPTSPLRHIYDAVRSGAISGMSVGGLFSREGNQIVKVEPVEWSLASVQIGRGSEVFEVTEGKSAQTKAEAVADLRRDITRLTTDVELSNVQAEIRRKEAERASLRTQATLDAVAAADATDRARYQHRKALHAASQPERATLIGSSTANGVGVVSERPTLDAVQSAAREASWAAHRDAVEARYQHACTEARAAGQPEPWRPMGPLPLAAPSWWSNNEGQTTVTTLDERVGLEDGLVETPTNVDIFGRAILPPVEEMLSPEDQLALAAASAEERPGLIERFKAKFRELSESKRDLEPQWEKPEGGTYHPYAEQKSPEQIFAEIARNEAALAAEGVDYE